MLVAEEAATAGGRGWEEGVASSGAFGASEGGVGEGSRVGGGALGVSEAAVEGGVEVGGGGGLAEAGGGPEGPAVTAYRGKGGERKAE